METNSIWVLLLFIFLPLFLFLPFLPFNRCVLYTQVLYQLLWIINMYFQYINNRVGDTEIALILWKILKKVCEVYSRETKTVLGVEMNKPVYGLPWWLSSKEIICNARETVLIPGSESSPGEGNGNPFQYSFFFFFFPFQYSCLGKHIARGAEFQRISNFPTSSFHRLPRTSFLPDSPHSSLPSLPIFITFITRDSWPRWKMFPK